MMRKGTVPQLLFNCGIMEIRLSLILTNLWAHCLAPLNKNIIARKGSTYRNVYLNSSPHKTKKPAKYYVIVCSFISFIF